MPDWVQWLNENWHLIALPVVAFVALIIVGRWLRRLVFDKYNRWALRTNRIGLSLFVARLYRPFLFWFFLLGAAAAIRVSVVPTETASITYNVLLSLFVGSWIWAAVSFSSTIEALYLPRLRQYLARVRAPQPPTALVVNGLRTVFIIAGLAILLNIWDSPNVFGLLWLATGFTIGFLALREAAGGLPQRLHLSYQAQKRLRSVGKVFLSLLAVAGIADIIRRIYLLSAQGLNTTSNLVILFLEIGFVAWFIHTLRSPDFRQARPSFKLVSTLFIITVVILAFAGLQPMANYKDDTLTYLKAQSSRISELVKTRSSQGEVAEIVESVRPAIVRLQAGNYVGTGMIIDHTGYVLTCNHLIEGVESATATLYDGRSYEASVVSQDEQKDLGIVKIDAAGVVFPCVTLGSSEQLKNGEEILAIGYSMGLEGETTVSKGIVSAFRNFDGVDLIQTDAAVNPGCSGGPLLNFEAEVVGVLVGRWPGEDIQGMGFAVSASSAKAFINDTIQLNQPSTQQDGTTNQIETMEVEVLALVNGERMSRGTPVLIWDDELGEIAEEHSQEMAKQGKLFHSSVSQPYAENCLGGSTGSAYYFDAGDIVDSWLSSDKHRTWLLCPHLEHVGVGIAVSGGEMYASWTFWRNETIYEDWWYDDGGSPPSWWY
jgi:S1-C subfamily serine protease